MMIRRLVCGAALLGSSVSLSACGSSAAPADATSAAAASGTFRYAPQVGKTYKHRMTRYQEFSVLGQPVRQAEEWIIDWDVEIQKEANNFVTVSRLVGLQIKVNGLDLLSGTEVAAKQAALEIVLDKDANISDIRGTETLTQALVDLAAPDAKDSVRAIFSPEQLRGLFFERVQERTRDLIGRPAKVGDSWMSNEGTGGVVTTKQLKVVGEQACGASTCLRVDRAYDIDKQAVWNIARAQVAAWVQKQGGNPDALQVGKAEIKLQDELLVEPGTLAFHHATFEQQANLMVGGFEGELEVQVRVMRESTYTY